MPRDLPVGNGSMLVTFDRWYSMRDLFFPRVGQENHTAGQRCRFGIWVEGEFAWLDSDEWQRELGYEHETMITRVTAESLRLGLRLRCGDVVDFQRNIYLKRIEVDNLVDREREVRLYFHFDCHLWGINVGDTAYFEPAGRALIHYKGRRYFWLCGQVDDHAGLAAFAAGRKDLPGLMGTWVDAQDGHLSGDPISQGSVDSVGALHLRVAPGGSNTAYYWLAAGESFREVEGLDEEVRVRGPATFFVRTRDYWHLWVNKMPRDFADLPQRIIEQYKRSLLVVRTQIDDGGAIIAANDSDIMQFGRDTYSYMWPRDGAFVAASLVHAGHQAASRRFFELCAELISDEGYLLHKYNPDGSLGSSWHPWVNGNGRRQLPIQEDETALVLWALWEHYACFRDLEFIKRVYNRLIIPAAEFLAHYRHEPTGLPAPSWDLWEERYGIFTFTTAAVWAGLQAASRFTLSFGDQALTQEFDQAAQEIRQAALRHLWDEESGRFLRGIRFDHDEAIRDHTLDSSLFATAQLGMLSDDDPRVVATMEAIEKRLWCQTPIGGLARYECDYYHRMSDDTTRVPGNPWILCTLWLAEWHCMRARHRGDLDKTRLLLEWASDRTLRSGVLPEQVHPYTGEPLSVAPLTWSHSTLVHTVHQYVSRYRMLRRA